MASQRFVKDFISIFLLTICPRTKKSTNKQTLCLKTMLETLCLTQRFQHTFG